MGEQHIASPVLHVPDLFPLIELDAGCPEDPHTAQNAKVKNLRVETPYGSRGMEVENDVDFHDPTCC